jgi:hypothetical protein
VQIPSHLSSEIVILAEAWDSPFDQDDSYTDDTQIALSQNTSSLAQFFPTTQHCSRHLLNITWDERRTC